MKTCKVKVFPEKGFEKPEKLSLEALCSCVESCKCAYEDVAELIEDKAYEECGQGKLDEALVSLKDVARFFETMENKNEENSRDLVDVYVLIGEICQFSERFGDSVIWLTKAVIVDDQYSTPFHNLAISYIRLGQIGSAIKSLEQEISLAPGNYYSYLLLADLYEKEDRADDMEDLLQKLLIRDPDNLQALHKLIRHYENTNPSIDVKLLQRRVLAVKKKHNRIEAVIRGYYLCKEKRFKDTLDFIDSWHTNDPEVTIVHLVKAYAYGELRQLSFKKRELTLFKTRNHGRDDIITTKLNEFSSIFGENALKKQDIELIISRSDISSYGSKS